MLIETLLPGPDAQSWTASRTSEGPWTPLLETFDVYNNYDTVSVITCPAVKVLIMQIICELFM